MGYYSFFTFGMKKDSKTKESFFEILEVFKNLSEGFAYICDNKEEEIKNAYQNEEKFEVYLGEQEWYEDEAELELEEMNDRFPHVLFKLNVEGEGYGDIWELRLLGNTREKRDAVIIPPQEQFEELIF